MLQPTPVYSQLTSAEEAFIQNLAGLSYTTGDILYYNGTNLTRLGIGSAGQILTVSGGIPAWGLSTGTGTVTSVSVVSANGLAGTVANPTTTPAITLSTSITGLLQGNGTAISAASTTGTGDVVLATSPTLVTPVLGTPTSGTLTNATGLPLTTGITGTLGEANGGTGETSYTDGQLLIGNTAGGLTKATLTAGTNVSITNGDGTITINASGGGGSGAGNAYGWYVS